MAESPRTQYIARKDPARIWELISEAQDRDDLNDWEMKFVEDLIESYEKMDFPEITQNQYNKLIEITDKKDDFQVW